MARAPDAAVHAALREDRPDPAGQGLADAGYFGRNMRAIEVLVDQQAVRSGAAAVGAPWK